MNNHSKKDQHVVAFFVTSYVLFLLSVVIYFGSKQASLALAEKEYSLRRSQAVVSKPVQNNVLGAEDLNTSPFLIEQETEPLQDDQITVVEPETDAFGEPDQFFGDSESEE